MFSTALREMYSVVPVESLRSNVYKTSDLGYALRFQDGDQLLIHAVVFRKKINVLLQVQMDGHFK